MQRAAGAAPQRGMAGVIRYPCVSPYEMKQCSRSRGIVLGCYRPPPPQSPLSIPTSTPDSAHNPLYKVLGTGTVTRCNTIRAGTVSPKRRSYPSSLGQIDARWAGLEAGLLRGSVSRGPGDLGPKPSPWAGLGTHWTMRRILLGRNVLQSSSRQSGLLTAWAPSCLSPTRYPSYSTAHPRGFSPGGRQTAF